MSSARRSSHSFNRRSSRSRTSRKRKSWTSCCKATRSSSSSVLALVSVIAHHLAHVRVEDVLLFPDLGRVFRAFQNSQHEDGAVVGIANNLADRAVRQLDLQAFG